MAAETKLQFAIELLLRLLQTHHAPSALVQAPQQHAISPEPPTSLPPLSRSLAPELDLLVQPSDQLPRALDEDVADAICGKCDTTLYDLPDEILLAILSYLDIYELSARVALVDKRLQKVFGMAPVPCCV